MSESTGESDYKALQAWVNRRFTDHLSWQVAYTWSHATSNVPLTSFTSGTTDPFNFDLDKGDSDLDRRHMFVSNAVFAMPSFKSRGGLVSNIFGNWQLNGILTLLSGIPLDVTTGLNGNYFGLASSAPGGFRVLTWFQVYQSISTIRNSDGFSTRLRSHYLLPAYSVIFVEDLCASRA